MAKVAQETKAEFVVAAGDNFYEEIQNHSQFDTNFENVFSDSSLNIEWWVVAGNHDHLGDVQHQLDYAKKSTRWKFPSLYYSFIKTLPTSDPSEPITAEFIMFDSTMEVGYKRQWQWIEEKLATSQANYLFTVSHYPVWSACVNGPTEDLINKLRPLMHQHKVTAHLSGHDHCLSHIQEGTAHHVLSGAGSRGWYELQHKDAVQGATGVKLKWYMSKENAGSYKGGFVSITLNEESAEVRYHGHDGSLLHTTEPIRPRAMAKKMHKMPMSEPAPEWW
eukprot:TRINITY_DN7180_c1_g1_i1.p1 TRINITY_DN7180_c1_g1~~TRINITY_DN7180_c1_g1_i1.p1  ORF type:complete len:305 (+),score=40.69 TRINITY_DN7180_c1_g1_i1:85-915(+)